jgi:hypothetical protein
VPSVAFAVEVHARLPLGPRSHGAFTYDAADFASCCGPVTCSPPHRDFVAPPRRQGSLPAPGASYRGPWRLPGPDSHRLAAVSLRSDIHIMDSSNLRPKLWAHHRKGTTLPPCNDLIGPEQHFRVRYTGVMITCGKSSSASRPTRGVPRRSEPGHASYRQPRSPVRDGGGRRLTGGLGWHRSSRPPHPAPGAFQAGAIEFGRNASGDAPGGEGAVVEMSIRTCPTCLSLRASSGSVGGAPVCSVQWERMLKAAVRRLLGGQRGRP